MQTQEPDQQLVERVQRGDKRAFDLLVLKYQHKILGLIVRFVHDSHEAQDVAQPERALLRDEIEATVHRTIQQLPEDLRTALTLREFEGLSYEDIATAMQCPVGTVRSRIFRAREAIDKALQPLLHEG